MTSKQISIAQWPHPLTATKGTLLDTALEAGVPYPHECRAGECGRCKTQLLQGEVRHTPYLAEALSREERERGLVLACRCYPRTDVQVRWLEDAAAPAPFAPRKQIARVQGLDRTASNVSRVWLALDDGPLDFAAGQYARLGFDDLPVRPYSMANKAGNDLMEFHIGHQPDGHVSGHVAKHLREGDRVHLEGPFGDAYLRKTHSSRPGPLIAVAGGTGLAPMLSILRTALDDQPETRARLYFAVRDHEGIYLEEELLRLAKAHAGLEIRILLSRPARPGAGHNRLVQTGSVLEALDEDFDSLADSCLYTAGSPRLVGAVKALATAKGISPDALHCDAFWSAPVPPRIRQRKGLTNRLARLFRS